MKNRLIYHVTTEDEVLVNDTTWHSDGSAFDVQGSEESKGWVVVVGLVVIFLILPED